MLLPPDARSMRLSRDVYSAHGAIAESAARRVRPRTGVLLAELRALIVRHARRDETTAIDGVLLSAAGRPGEPEASTTGTVMALIAQGAKRLAIGDRIYDYGPGQYLVASVDLPITGHYTHASADEPALGFGLILRPQPIAVTAPGRGRDARADAAATRPPRRLRGSASARPARAPRRRRAHGAPARQPARPRRPGADDRARDPLAPHQRPARRGRCARSGWPTAA